MPVVSVLPALAEDLTTDWLPDAVAGAGAAGNGPIKPVGRMDVAAAGGSRTVVLAPMPLRVRGHQVAERCLPDREAALSPGVFGYRDAGSAYRGDWAKFRAAAARPASARAVEVRFDVRQFFATVPAGVLDAFGTEAGHFARSVETEYGQCLLPGHRWARRFANAVLDGVDRSISAPFVRWQDDYRVFVHDRDEAASVLAVVAERLDEMGLALNADKTRIGHAQAPAPDNASPRAPGWKAAVTTRDVPRLKFLLRLAAEVGDGRAGGPDDEQVPTPGLACLVAQEPVLAPRAVWALVSRAGDAAARIELAAVAGSSDPWVAARGLAGFAACPALSDAAPERAVASAADNPHAAVRALAARILHWQGRPFPVSIPHVDRVLRDCAPAALVAVLPVVATTL
jgi:hypothetical protein